MLQIYVIILYHTSEDAAIDSKAAFAVVIELNVLPSGEVLRVVLFQGCSSVQVAGTSCHGRRGCCAVIW